MSTIIINNVSKSYGKVKAVKDLSLTVNEGEIYGFIGPNGAGKSTTIRMMLNLLKIDKGEISILGYSPKNNDVEIKKITGYVPADTFMYRDMKVSDLFSFTESFFDINATERIKQLVEILDIDVTNVFENLSFGNRKKVSIACAMLHRPKVLILDEPSNGLDPVIRTNLYDLLKLEQKEGVTIFFSSHVLHEVQKFCTRIGLIKEGSLIREETAAAFTDIGYRNVRVECDCLLDFSKLSGVANLRQDGNVTQFMHSGDPNELIKHLSSVKLHSLHIEEPELEDVFMHYFK